MTISNGAEATIQLRGNINMICRECGSVMFVDDREYRFKGNYDLYWNCTECSTSCIEEVRFDQIYKEIWHSENGKFPKDYAIKHQIKR